VDFSSIAPLKIAFGFGPKSCGTDGKPTPGPESTFGSAENQSKALNRRWIGEQLSPLIGLLIGLQTAGLRVHFHDPRGPQTRVIPVTDSDSLVEIKEVNKCPRKRARCTVLWKNIQQEKGGWPSQSSQESPRVPMLRAVWHVRAHEILKPHASTLGTPGVGFPDYPFSTIFRLSRIVLPISGRLTPSRVAS
jgi:hypothetical protein